MSSQNISNIKLPMETTFERIFSFYVNETALTAKEEQIRDRWDAAYSLMVNYHSREQAVPLLHKKFNISKAQAHRDITNALKLFGDINKSNKDGMRNILYEYSMKIFQLAASAKPPDLDQMNRAITNMIKIQGLDKEDPSLPDFKNFQQHIYNIVCDPSILGMRAIPDLDAELAKFKQLKLKTINIDDSNSAASL